MNVRTLEPSCIHQTLWEEYLIFSIEQRSHQKRERVPTRFVWVKAFYESSSNHPTYYMFIFQRNKELKWIRKQFKIELIYSVESN